MSGLQYAAGALLVLAVLYLARKKPAPSVSPPAPYRDIIAIDFTSAATVLDAEGNLAKFMVVRDMPSGFPWKVQFHPRLLEILEHYLPRHVVVDYTEGFDKPPGELIGQIDIEKVSEDVIRGR